MSTVVLEAEGLGRRFGGLAAVRDVSLQFRRGELHAVIGPNGAGKSTFINLLSGELPPSAGRLRLNGQDVTGWANWRLARAGIGRTFQHSNLLRGLSVLENVRLGAQARLARGWQLLRRPDGLTRDAALSALDRVGLADQAALPAGALSHGMLKQVEIAMALATGPHALLLDEPLAGAGPEESASLAALLRELARDLAVLLVEHDMDVVFAVADRVSVLLDGAMLETGAPVAIQNSPAVRDAYLGQEG